MISNGFLRALLLILAIVLSITDAWAGVTKCGAVWTDKPCVDGQPEVTLKTPPPSDTSDPAVISETLESTPAAASIDAPANNDAPTDSDPTPPVQAQIKPLIMDRPEPWMDWRREEVANTKWVFKGKLKGNGKTRISLVISKASYTGNVTREYVEANKIFNLPSWGGEIEFNFPVDVPPPMRTWNWRWFLKAEYVGKWDGYRDLRGCCGVKDVEARCKKDGSVECSPSRLSESCRCF